MAARRSFGAIGRRGRARDQSVERQQTPGESAGVTTGKTVTLGGVPGQEQAEPPPPEQTPPPAQ